MINDTIRPLLRSPIELKPLIDGDNEFKTSNGEVYPIIDGILCLLSENERNADLGDKKFYNSTPFGISDCKDEDKKIVEKDFKNLLEEFDPTSVIIDVGCGAGRISKFLSLKGYKNVVSLDFSLMSLKLVRKRSNNICVWSNNLHLPFESDSFDLVISTGVIHHTPDPHKAFEECVRILKSGGKLYLKVYNKISPYSFLYHTYGRILRVCDKSRYTSFLSELLGFRMYKFIRKFFYSLPNEKDHILRGKYDNLFMKNMVYFFSNSEIEGLIEKHKLIVRKTKKSGFSHRMHFYVAEKAY